MRFVMSAEGMIPVVDGMIEQVKADIKAQIQEYIMAGLAAGLEVLKEVSFTVALIGGGICIIVYAVTGIKRVGKVFAVLVLAHALIRYLIGG